MLIFCLKNDTIMECFYFGYLLVELYSVCNITLGARITYVYRFLYMFCAQKLGEMCLGLHMILVQALCFVDQHELFEIKLLCA